MGFAVIFWWIFQRVCCIRYWDTTRRAAVWPSWRTRVDRRRRRRCCCATPASPIRANIPASHPTPIHPPSTCTSSTVSRLIQPKAKPSCLRGCPIAIPYKWPILSVGPSPARLDNQDCISRPSFLRQRHIWKRYCSWQNGACNHTNGNHQSSWIESINSRGSESIEKLQGWLDLDRRREIRVI